MNGIAADAAGAKCFCSLMERKAFVSIGPS